MSCLALALDGDVVTQRFLRKGHSYEVRYRVVSRTWVRKDFHELPRKPDSR